MQPHCSELEPLCQQFLSLPCDAIYQGFLRALPHPSATHKGVAAAWVEVVENSLAQPQVAQNLLRTAHQCCIPSFSKVLMFVQLPTETQGAACHPSLCIGSVLPLSFPVSKAGWQSGGTSSGGSTGSRGKVDSTPQS